MAEDVRVLVVDDEPDLAEMASVFLEREGTALVADVETDPADGIERFDAEPYDCVVSDYDMPGMNGLELLAAVRERAPDLPFVLFTGKGSEEIASEAISAGVTDYLQKEVGTDQFAVLANTVENAVEKHRTERALRESRYRFDAVFHDPNSFIGLLETDGTVTRVNQTALDAVDADADDVEDEKFWRTPWWPDDVREDLRSWIDAAADGDFVRFHARNVVEDDGSGNEGRVLLDVLIRPVRDEDGEVDTLIAEGRSLEALKERVEAP
ncbi:response regulator [Halomicrococcus gelatinilyticus]|uniref:response regulator n=1 Tax=Halomicrococcus gelatinilyticus TaxID=1702103 RepID=UPI002E165FEE